MGSDPGVSGSRRRCSQRKYDKLGPDAEKYEGVLTTRRTTPTRYQEPTERGMLFIIALVLPLAGCQGERLRETTQPEQGELLKFGRKSLRGIAPQRPNRSNGSES